ncbi:MAG: EAL domain-containing protein [Gammaproteobacteria bacterium]|nr:EAL domain-containing protein [Gammaproteobacteria bacterium]
MPIATVNNPQVNDPGIDQQVLAERVNLLFAGARGLSFFSLLLAALIASVFYLQGRDLMPVYWAAALFTVLVVYLLLNSGFQRKQLFADAGPTWLRRFRVATLLQGLAWGAGAVLLFGAGNEFHQLLLGFSLFGGCALALSPLSHDTKSYLALVLPVFAGVMSGIVLTGGEYLPLALLSTLGLLVPLLVLARREERESIAALRARFAYAEMAEEFDQEVTTRLRAEDSLLKGEQRGQRQSYALLELAREEAIISGDIPRALTVITEKAAKAIECNRVSVWLCDEDFNEFRCAHVFDKGYHDEDPSHRVLTGPHAHHYRRIEKSRTIAISDTRRDRRLLDFWETYIAPFRTGAILAAPFRYNGKVSGLIVHEHIGRSRNWILDERMFASSLADFVALTLSAAGRQQVQEQLRHLANFDRLTGLPNRVMFHDRLVHALKKAERFDRKIALLFVDLDRFKSINDSLGHQMGDRVLRRTAKRLVRCVRGCDTVTRLGGDEFTVILEEIEDTQTVITVAERIIETLGDPLYLDDYDLHLTASIGIAMFPEDGKDAETLLQNADTAMYRSKKDGRNRLQFFTEDMHDQALEKLDREREIRHAIENEEFELYFQPQLDLRTGRNVGFEALVRWNHPERGFVMPGEFIALAEESGLIARLGEWVMREGCRQAKSWYDEFGDDFHIAVNLSAAQFIAQSIPDLVADALKESGLPPELLLLEITESLAVGEGVETLRLLQDLKKLGCRLALDDFGTGSSSLSYLKSFPVDIIKIDRSFVSDLNGDAHDAAIARATIGLAQSLGLDVIAEGVETQQQLDWLLGEGCGIVQGFLFSEPLAAEACWSWLDNPQRMPPLEARLVAATGSNRPN